MEHNISYREGAVGVTNHAAAGGVDEPAAKRTKKDPLLDRLLDEAVGSTSTNQDVACEVASYLAEKPAMQEYRGPAAMVEVNESRFPHVAVLARKYFASPASFSTRGLVADN